MRRLQNVCSTVGYAVKLVEREELEVSSTLSLSYFLYPLSSCLTRVCVGKPGEKPGSFCVFAFLCAFHFSLRFSLGFSILLWGFPLGFFNSPSGFPRVFQFFFGFSGFPLGFFNSSLGFSSQVFQFSSRVFLRARVEMKS